MVTESYWPNADGGAVYERRLAHGLADRGHEVVIWAPGASWRSSQQQDGNTLIEREKAFRFAFNKKYKVSYWPWLRARTMLRRYQPDVIHVHNFFYMGLATLFWAKVYKVPIVATNHFMPENLLLNVRWLQPLYKQVHRWTWAYLVSIHNRAAFVTSPTPTAIQLLEDHGLKAPHEAITNGVETEIFTPRTRKSAATVAAKYGIAADKPALLYLGRLDGEKRIDVIVDALPTILASHPVQLVLAGSGKAKAGLIAQAQRLGVASSVHFPGFIDEEDKAALYNTASVFVMSSPAELQSIVTLEAMASGLPVLSVDVAALHELCQDGKNGYLFAEGNSAALSSAAIRLLSDSALTKKFGAESRRITTSHHSNDVMIDSYERVLADYSKKQYA